MKKLGLLIGLTLLVGLMNSSFAQKDRTLSNGFSVNLVTGFPSSSYATDDGDAINDDYKFRSMWGLQLGNRWYFAPTEQMGFGLMVNWIDFTYAIKTSSIAGVDIARGAMDLTFIEIGPMGTYVIGEGMAVDGYYNLRPTLLSTAAILSGSGSGDETFAYAGFGFSHAIGAAFRIKVFNFGLEYNFGAINSVGTYTGSMTGITMNDQKNKTNSVRIMLGFKF